MNPTGTSLYDMRTCIGREVNVVISGDRKWFGVLTDVHHSDLRIQVDGAGIVIADWHTVMQVEVL